MLIYCYKQKKYFDSSENSQSEIAPLLSLNEGNNSEKDI